MQGGQTTDALWRLSSSSVTLRGGPVEFRPVRATPCEIEGFTDVSRKVTVGEWTFTGNTFPGTAQWRRPSGVSWRRSTLLVMHQLVTAVVVDVLTVVVFTDAATTKDAAMTKDADAFRLLLDVPRWTSASSLFVLHRVPTFAAVIRKLTYSLYDCIRSSSNSLLIAYVESDLYYRSKLLHKWRSMLYTCTD